MANTVMIISLKSRLRAILRRDRPDLHRSRTKLVRRLRRLRRMEVEAERYDEDGVKEEGGEAEGEKMR